MNSRTRDAAEDARDGRATPRPWVEWVAWFALLVVVTAFLISVRPHLNATYITLGYLLVVQGGSARRGRPLGLALAAVAFLSFDYFFLPPFGTFTIQDPLNWFVLLAFLATAVLSAQLLYRAQAEAAAARQRAVEIDRLASLGAETLSTARAEDALVAIASVIRTSLSLDRCGVYAADAESRGVRLAAESSEPAKRQPIDEKLVESAVREGRPAAEFVDGSSTADASAELIVQGDGAHPAVRAFIRPLQARGRTVGVLRVARNEGLSASAAQIRVLDALSYYAALGLERVRLVADAERAQTLQEAHRAKDAVLASVSHDLRTPLTTIKGLAHEIAAGGDDRADVIEEEADRLNRFVAQMLDLSRITTGVAAPNVQPNEAEDLLGAAAQQVSGRLAGRELRVTTDSSEALLFGSFDFSETLRAIVNLIDNAAKYSPPGTPIDLTATLDGRWLVFAVADRGPGVPRAERERIFEAFYRRPGPQSGAPDVGGAGLGLSISRGIAAAQGGGLDLEERPGGGSIFRFRVPAIPSSAFDGDGEGGFSKS
ncbi:MAG TPA: ATP-binding protein [Gemmatimonadaceae bacterium]|nr:ATP-binding protein [Gemmatimonadaceae bacterium]